MITLRFVSHPGLFNWACSIAQYGFWCTHVEAVMPDGTLLGAISDGVKARAPNYDIGKFSREMFVRISVAPEHESSFYAFLRSQIGKPYDSQAIWAFYGKRDDRDWQAPSSWFCSELMAAALAEYEVFPQHMAEKFNRVTPRDLMLLISTRTEPR